MNGELHNQGKNEDFGSVQHYKWKSSYSVTNLFRQD